MFMRPSYISTAMEQVAALTKTRPTIRSRGNTGAAVLAGGLEQRALRDRVAYDKQTRVTASLEKCKHDWNTHGNGGRWKRQEQVLSRRSNRNGTAITFVLKQNSDVNGFLHSNRRLSMLLRSCNLRGINRNVMDALHKHYDSYSCMQQFLFMHAAIVWQELLFLEETKSKEGHVRHSSVSDCDAQVL